MQFSLQGHRITCDHDWKYEIGSNTALFHRQAIGKHLPGHFLNKPMYRYDPSQGYSVDGFASSMVINQPGDCFSTTSSCFDHTAPSCSLKGGDQPLYSSVCLWTGGRRCPSPSGTHNRILTTSPELHSALPFTHWPSIPYMLWAN